MSGTDTRFQKEVVAAAGGFSEPVYFPRRVNEVSVQAIPGAAGSATIYFTLDPISTVQADPNNADLWEAWEPDAVTVKTSRALAGPVTALKIGAVGDQAKMKVAGAYDF